jgi:CubicO group peptidase (beta-lactamase class C family)
VPDPRTTSTPTIEGIAEDGFGAVADAFRDNFEGCEELGAAVAVYGGGRKVVDLWGGIADALTDRPWTQDTRTVVFSCTKGLLAICAYRLVEEGRLDLDAPVIDYWPEFGRNGKERIPVRWLLSHRAGLPVVDRALSRQDCLAWRPAIEALEAQAPIWDPGTAHTYHAKTYGWLVGEVIHRVTGVMPGVYFARAIAEPLGVRTRIGVPVEEQVDVARIEPPPDPASQVVTYTPTDVELRALTINGAIPFPTVDGDMTYNAPDMRAAELPGTNAISSARDLARIYAACVGEVVDIRLMGDLSIDDALLEQSSGAQLFGPDGPQRWSTGFMLDSRPFRWMLGPRSFGHDGAGGLLAFADAASGIGFAYVANRMGGPDDQRANRLVKALAAAL